MRNLLFLFISFFLFVGCAPKKVIIDKKPIEKPKNIIIPKQPITEEKIQVIEAVKPEILEINEDGLNKVAVIYASKEVGRFAKSTMSTASAFLLYNDVDFEIEGFDTYDENYESILEKVKSLNEKGFTKVIALFTIDGFKVLNSLNESRNARYYFPLINKSEVITTKENFIFGGISYKDQLELLQTLSNDRNTMFYVKSYLGDKLKSIYENTFRTPGLIKEIERDTNNFKGLMKDKRMTGDTIILNTPIVKTSIILSQLTAFEINPSKVLSTQLNYNPMIVKLTQDRDRNNFYVVSAISSVDDFLEEYANILGGDVVYNWVDYSSLVGLNYLLFDRNEEVIKSESSVVNDTLTPTEPKKEISIIKTKVKENQADYEQTLYETTSYGFTKVNLN